MKIAWFTPFSNNSAIGMVGKEVCEELSKSYDVDIWSFQTENIIETTVNIIHFNSKTEADELDKYDHIFYNIGNFAGNHREIYDMLAKKSGYVILHDQTMAGFWAQYYLFPEWGGDSIKGFQPYKDMFKKYYGRNAENLCQEAYDASFYPINEYKYMSEYKLIEPFLENAKGVFTHANFFADSLKDIYNGSIGVSYLPCKLPEKVDCKNEEIKAIINDARRKGKKILVSNGIVHPVKQIDKVANVLCENMELKDKFCYIVIGSYGGEYGESLERLSKEKLKDCLFLMGYQPMDVMNYAIKNADMCINMRYPNSEVCSLSLLEQMSFSKPVLTLNSGIYKEIPNQCSVKIDYHEISENLKVCLENFEDNIEFYKKIGIGAGNFIEKKCTAKAYAENIIGFIKMANENHCIAKFQNRVLDSISVHLKRLEISEDTLPSTVANVVNAIDAVMARKEIGIKNKALGIWAGFIYHVPGLNREGIARFISFLCNNLIKYYDVTIEVWSYSFNSEEMKICFSEILDNPSLNHKIKIINENNFMKILDISQNELETMGDINESKDNLAFVAREFSNADVFMPLIVYLDNVIGTEKKILVPAHDMAIAKHYDDFCAKDYLYKSRHLDILYRAENLARYGAEFSSNCKTVMDTQILKYVKNLKPSKAHFIYLPVNVPANIEKNIMSEDEVRTKFSIEGRYMYYPTQVRPYKNISSLIKAFHQLRDTYRDLKLVLTGNPKDMPEVDALLQEFDLYKRTILLKNLTEKELYSIYQYASVVPVTSKFEGGFPWQACEALFMKVPLVLSNIDVVKERMESCGFSEESSQISLFDPMDYKSLALSISKALDNKKGYLKQQEKFASVLLSWDWKQAASQYYKILFGDTGDENEK